MKTILHSRSAIALLVLIVVIIGVRLGIHRCRAEEEGHVSAPLPSHEDIAQLPPDGGPEFNRLIFQTSPYLLQHARNPVDWYPWGNEAFERAREADKPVFVSVGYSMCHWCHVMERESFESQEVARILNDNYVAIKVDRAERPDLDEVYMHATQLLTGSGGWPNSVWLTPDRKPWYAGTYFAPEDRFGRPGFKTLLTRLSEMWRIGRDEVEAHADQLSAALRALSAPADAPGTGELDRSVVAEALSRLRESFDAQLGWFGGAPKFPPHTSLELILYEHARTRERVAVRMATRTLEAMARGGIHDHVGGGSHRYSTDERWLVPHFEKMLYDNAQLSRIYVQGYLATGDEHFREVAESIYGWVLREMQDDRGGFYSALDADSEGEEGKFYVWRHDEVLDILGPDAGEPFCRAYNVNAGGNFREEASGRRSRANALHLTRGFREIAQAEELPEADLRARLQVARRKLREHRDRRVWPHLDDKMLTAWNGLMIGSLAFAGQHLDQPRYLSAAERAADFILTEMSRGGKLLRSYRKGVARIQGYLDDYALFAQGLVDLYEATGRKRWLEEAKGLADVLLADFRDHERGGFFFTSADHEGLLIRSKRAHDSAIPSGNGVAARLLVRLGRLTGEPRYTDAAESTLRAFVGAMRQAPGATQSLVLLLASYLDRPGDALATVPHTRAGDRADGRSRKGPITVEVFSSRTTVSPGETFTVAVRLQIADGYHINCHEPLQEHLMPTQVSLDDLAGVPLGEVAYPDGRRVIPPFSDDPVCVYEGEVWIHVPLTVSRDFTPGELEPALKVSTQPCNDRSCLSAQEHHLLMPVTIRPSAGASEVRHGQWNSELPLSDA